ncbi:MAG: hypothetical protein ACJ790_11820 [Myxococcaceae bacterium]
MTVRLASTLLLLLAVGCTKPPLQTGRPDTGDNTGAGTGGTDSGSGTDSGTTEQSSLCPSYGSSVRTGSNPSILPELSGLAASHKHAGVFWAENDSGNALELIGIREDGSVVAQIPLTGATNTDVEDISLGPCANGSADTCVYLSDIGDNNKVRSSVAIYRLKEPDTLDNTPRAVDVLAFTYPDGAHNAESFIVDPKNAQLYVLTKAAGTLGDVYRLDNLAVGQSGSATKIASVTAPNNSDQISTAADVHPSGERILIRTYSHLWELRSPGALTVETVWTAQPVEIPAAVQPQGEAVSYLADGRGYLLGTEGVGEGLFRVDCRQ